MPWRSADFWFNTTVKTLLSGARRPWNPAQAGVTCLNVLLMVTAERTLSRLRRYGILRSIFTGLIRSIRFRSIPLPPPVHVQVSTQLRCLIEFDKIDARYVWMDVTNVSHTLPYGHAIHEFKIFLPGAVGGPPARPYQPAGLWKEKTLGGAYVRDRGAGLYRRSLYTIWKRTSPPPSMVTFDASRRSFCVMKRQTTTTPLQALVLMNDPQYVEAGRKLAERMLTEGGASVRDQLQFAFRLLTSRHARDRELDVLEKLYQTQVTRFDGDTKSRDALLTVGDSRAAASLPKSPLAAHAVVAGMLMSYDQCVMKR